MRCIVSTHVLLNQINRLEDTHTSTNDYVKFHGNLRTQAKNQLMVEKFSTFSVVNLDPMYTTHKHASNTVYNIDTHALLDTTDTIGLGSIAIFRNAVKTKVNSPNFHF
jgi:hypothetical protein